MILPDLTQPISDDAPCGPDLYAAMDPAFDEYLLAAEERLPQSFFGADGKARVDPGSIRIKDEVAAATALLARARDLRVLAVLAQYCALARNLGALSDCVAAMADLLETQGAHAHPQIEGDVIERANALELLDSKPTVCMPLEFMPLADDRRLRALTWRRHAIAQGQRQAMAEDGQTPDGDALMAALRAAENADQISASHDRLLVLKAGLGRIKDACLLNEDTPFKPNFDNLETQIDAMVTLLQQARPDLGGGEGEGAVSDDGDAPADMAEVQDTRAAAMPVNMSGVTSPLEARQTLQALETYLRQHEPSSLALVLTRQARQLLGLPLTAALELLLTPDQLSRARIDFSREMGFSLTIDRLQALCEDTPATEDVVAEDTATEDVADTPAEGADHDARAVPVITSRPQAAAAMSALEHYFAAKEPSSPIPLLLTRARGSLNQSFVAILAELFPPDTD